MAATITGIVFNDLNRNGQYDSGEPGIPGVNVVLYGASQCVTAQTDANGNYSFSAAAGTYTVYETVESPNACPPTAFSQPSGFNVSNGPRKRAVTVTAAQANNGAVISGQNFSHAEELASLTCNATMIQFAGNPSDWYNIDLVTGASTEQGLLSPSHYVNAIGFSPVDNFIYGYDQTAGNLARIDAKGDLTALLPNPTGLPADTYTTGCFDEKGFFYLYAVNEARFYTVDLRPDSATYLKLVNPATGAEQTGNYGTALSAPLDVSDWAINPQDGYLYGVNRSGNVCRVVPSTGAVTVLTTTGPKEAAATSYGACGFDFNGNLYVIANSSGIIRKYTIAGNTANGEIFSQSVATSNNDGAMCYFAAVNVDYGDAPDLGAGNYYGNYNTLLQNNGPRHALVSELYLGTRVTAEQDAHQNYDATGDDLTQGIQDDGLYTPLPLLFSHGGPYVLDVTVTNRTDRTAFLYGWIDYNFNGLFENNEAAQVVSIPAGSGTQTYPLFFDTMPLAMKAGHTFVRLRLTSDMLVDEGGEQDTRSVGAASDGEVEDYIVEIRDDADLFVVKVGSPKPVVAGDLLIYTIVIGNYGPSVSRNVVLTDAVPAELLNVEFSEDGVNWQLWTGSYYAGDLFIGESRTVYLRGTVSPSAAGTIENTAVVSSDTPDPDPGNNQSTDTTPVAESADLAVTKSGSPNPVMTGEMLIYTVNVRNFGPSDAQNAVLTDPLPAQLLNPQFSTDGGNTWQAWNGSYNVGTIPNGSTLTFLLRGTVAPSTSGVLENTVRIDSPTPDPVPDNNEDTELTPVNNAADVSVTKTGSPKPVLRGDRLIYGVNIVNHGPDTAMNVVLSDPIPPELYNAEYSTDGGNTWLAWTGSYALGNLLSGESRQIFLRGTVAQTAQGTIENTATVTSDTPDPNPDNNTDTDLTPIGSSADLSVTKTASPDPVTAGSTITYTVTIRNAGPDASENTVLTDVVPPSVENPEFAVQGSSVFAPWVSPYAIGTLAAGESYTVTIRGRVAAGAAAGDTIANTAVVTSDTPDPDPDNNTDTAEVDVVVAADLAVVKRANAETAVPGELLTYTITVSNNGPSDAEAVLLIDAVPIVLENAEYSTDGGATWNAWANPHSLGTLAANTSIDVLLRGRVSAEATGDIVNTATVTSPTPDPDPTNNSSTETVPVEPSADLLVRKTALTTPVATGFPVTFAIVVQNLGPATAENTLLTDILPAGTTGAEFSLDNGATWQPWNGSLPLGDLAASSSVNVQIRATLTADAANPISNTATVTSDTPDPNPDNNTDTEEVEVVLSADFSVTKSAEPDPVLAGETLTYTIVVKNLGPGSAQNVVVSDDLPAELSNAEYSVDGGATWLSWNGSYGAGTLANGAALTLLLRGTVPEGAAGRLSNTATATGDTPDPNPDNNSDTVETCVCPGVTPADSADLSLVKTATETQVSPGGLIEFTLTARNNGPDAAENVYLYDSVPDSLLQPEYSLDGGVTWQVWYSPLALGILGAGESVQVLLRGRAAADASSVVNTAVITSSTPDPNPSDNTDTEEVVIVPSADLSLVKSAFQNCAVRCETLCYQLTITNFGRAPAENVIVTDPVPKGLRDMQVSVDRGKNWTFWTGGIHLGTLAPNTVATILLRGVVDGCAAGFITNIARVSSSTPDSNPGNNVSAVTVPVCGCEPTGNWYCECWFPDHKE